MTSFFRKKNKNKSKMQAMTAKKTQELISQNQK